MVSVWFIKLIEENIVVKGAKFTTSLKYSMFFISCCIVMAFFSDTALASVTPAGGGGGGAQDWGSVAAGVTGTFKSIGKLITAGSYLAGLGFSIGAIMKFKQHKDNPSQTPVGTPIALVFIAAALLFLPSVLASTGSTMFEKATTAGPSGVEIK
jgi:intracellular multiplication protein IcmD